MPSPQSSGCCNNNIHSTQRDYGANRRGGRLAVIRASSFQGGGEWAEEMAGALPRPRTVPELIRRSGGGDVEVGNRNKKAQQQLAKVLVKVEVVRSIGPLHVVVPMASTVEDLIVAAVKQYVKEYRRPALESNEPSMFDLHYSQFSLESLDRKEKVMELGSRNFFLCPNMMNPSPSSSSSFDEAEKPNAKKGSAWLRFMYFTR